MEPYGQWRFLTYNDLVLQFVTYSVCLVTHFLPSVTRFRDFIFTTLAFPMGMLVVSSFWAVWFLAGRENILPVESGCPDWLNHVVHTIMMPINLVQLMLVQHQFSSDRLAVKSLLVYILAYASYLFYIRFRTGRYVYIFLNKMNGWAIATFIAILVGLALLIYWAGKLLHGLVHDYRNRQIGENQAVYCTGSHNSGIGSTIQSNATIWPGADPAANSNGMRVIVIEHC